MYQLIPLPLPLPLPPTPSLSHQPTLTPFIHPHNTVARLQVLAAYHLSRVLVGSFAATFSALLSERGGREGGRERGGKEGERGKGEKELGRWEREGGRVSE